MAVESPIGNDYTRMANDQSYANDPIFDFMMRTGSTEDGEKNPDPAAEVTQYSALTIGPFYRAVNILCGIIGRLDISLNKIGENNKTVMQKEDDRNFLVRKKPNSSMKSRTWRKQLQLHAMLTPGGFSEIIRLDPKDTTSPILAVQTLDPNYVMYGIYKDSSGIDHSVYFYFDDPNKPPRPIHFDNMIHVKGLSYNGVMGIDPINLLRQEMGLAIARRNHAKFYFNGNGFIRGFLEVPATIDAGKFVNMMMQLRAMRQEAGEDPTKAIPLFDGVKFNRATDTPDDSQLLDSLSVTPEMVSSWTGVPAMLLGKVEGGSYNAFEKIMEGFHFTTIHDWLDEYEDELDDKLLTEKELKEDELHFQFNREELMALLVENYHQMIRENFKSGLISWEEARVALRRHTDANDGKFFLPQNLVGANPIQVGDSIGDEPSDDDTSDQENKQDPPPKDDNKKNVNVAPPAVSQPVETTPAQQPVELQVIPPQLIELQNNSDAGGRLVVIRDNANHHLNRICTRISKSITSAAKKEDFQKQMERINQREKQTIAEDVKMLNNLSLALGTLNQPVSYDLFGVFAGSIHAAIEDGGEIQESVDSACKTATETILSEFTDLLSGVNPNG